MTEQQATGTTIGHVLITNIFGPVLCGVQGGDMKATLLLGDPTVADSISWDLGSLHVPEDPEVAPTPKYLTATFQPLNNVKPEIRHIFVSVIAPWNIWCRVA